MSSVAPSPSCLASAQMVDPVEGATYGRWYPFKREDFHGFDADGPFTSPTWNPGWRYELVGHYGDSCPVWDGEGVQMRHVVSIHKPGRYPTRVFYTRQFRSPDGWLFGKTSLRMTTLAAFRNWMRSDTHKRLLDEGGILAEPESPDDRSEAAHGTAREPNQITNTAASKDPAAGNSRQPCVSGAVGMENNRD